MTSKLSLGDKGPQIESSTIRIPRPSKFDCQYHTNPIPMTDSSQGSQFGCNFNLFLIKVNHFGSLWISFQLKDKKSQLKDWKSWFKDRKSQNITKKSIYFDFFDHFWSFWSLSINFELFVEILTCFDQFWFQEFGSKKSIKRPFDRKIS